LKRKNDSIQEQLGRGHILVLSLCLAHTGIVIIAGLQLKIVAEDKIVENKINDILHEWEQTRPVQGNIRADTAMSTINIFEGKLKRVQEEYDLVCRAKEALDLELTRHTRLDPVFEELRDLKAVWTALSGIWSQIARIEGIVVGNSAAKEIEAANRRASDVDEGNANEDAPVCSFRVCAGILRGLLKSNSLISELKSEALKDRHWKQLFKN
jgi:dynein heavy chain 1